MFAVLRIPIFFIIRPWFSSLVCSSRVLFNQFNVICDVIVILVLFLLVSEIAWILISRPQFTFFIPGLLHSLCEICDNPFFQEVGSMYFSFDSLDYFQTICIDLTLIFKIYFYNILIVFQKWCLCLKISQFIFLFISNYAFYD